MSDAERDAVAEFLQVHYTAGRLTHDELGARVEAAYRSRWRSQLLTLTRDLPPVEQSPPPQRRSPRLAMAAVTLLTLVALAALVSGLPDELQILLAVLVVPMLVALSVIIVPFVLLVAAIRWVTDRLSGASRVLVSPPDALVRGRARPR